MIAIQLDLFKTKEECEFDAMRQSIQEMKKSQERVRKKLFAENGQQKKIILDLSERMEIIERNICKGML